MNHLSRPVRAGVVTAALASTLVLAPVASASEADPGAARDDIGNYTPPTQPAPGVDSTGADAGDVMLGAAAGLVLVGGAGAVIAMRRRHPLTHHPA